MATGLPHLTTKGEGMGNDGVRRLPWLEDGLEKWLFTRKELHLPATPVESEWLMREQVYLSSPSDPGSNPSFSFAE